MKAKNVILFILFIAFIFIQNAVGQKVDHPQTLVTESGIAYTIKEKGNGRKPIPGDKVVINYTGKLRDGTVFDSSIPRGAPYTVKIGVGQLIPGLDEAILLLQVGDKATIKFGYELGYGEAGAGAIPPKATLIFDIELLNVIEGPKPWITKGKDTLTISDNLKYVVIRENKSGEKIAADSKITFHFNAYLMNGKLFDSSIEREQPLTVKLNKGMLIKGLEEGLVHLHKGEKAQFLIPYALGYGEAGRPPTLPAKSDLIYDIEILEVASGAPMAKYDVSDKELKTTGSGLKYYEVYKSTGKSKASEGYTVTVNYSGYFEDGNLFDSSSDRSVPLSFKLGQRQVIAGWDEGIALMHAGDKFRFIIPYYLAYGEIGHPPTIPPKAELTFDIEVIEVK